VLANLAFDPDINLYGLYQNDIGDEGQYEGKAASTWVVLCADKPTLLRLKHQESDFRSLLYNMYIGRFDALTAQHKQLEGQTPHDLTDRDMAELIELKQRELAELKDKSEIERKTQELDRLKGAGRASPTEKDLKDLIKLKEWEIGKLQDAYLVEKRKLQYYLEEIPDPGDLPRTFREFFPEVREGVLPMMLMPNQLAPVQSIGCILAHQMDVPVWYDLDRTRDDSVGVWTDDYASIPSVFTPLKRRLKKE
jgi:hypothetical protein